MEAFQGNSKCWEQTFLRPWQYARVLILLIIRNRLKQLRREWLHFWVMSNSCIWHLIKRIRKHGSSLILLRCLRDGKESSWISVLIIKSKMSRRSTCPVIMNRFQRKVEFQNGILNVIHSYTLLTCHQGGTRWWYTVQTLIELFVRIS